MNYYNYFSEIEELFIRRRGRNLLLSPLDWALIETWQERAVPLHVILSAIERVFDGVEKQPTAARKRPIKSLMYCREEIEAQHAAWLERQTGKNGGAENEKSAVRNPISAESELFSDEMIAAHFERVSDELKSARSKSNGNLRDCFDDVLQRLDELQENLSTEKNLEQSLEKLDARIDAALLSNFANDGVKAEIRKQLAGYRAKMDENAYNRTFDLMLLKRLREQTRVPRLSLYHL